MTNLDAPTRAAVAKTLEAGWKTFAGSFPPPAQWRPQEVVVFAVREEFLDWVKTFAPELGEKSDGFYDPAHDQLVFYERLDDLTGERTREVTVHEAFHGYAARSLPRLPSWLDEGLADSFGMESYAGKPSYQVPYLKTFAAEGSGYAQLRLKKLVDSTYAEFHDREHDEKERPYNYCRSWLVGRALRAGEGSLAGVLAKLLGALAKPDGALRAREEVLDDATMKALEKLIRREITSFLEGS